MRLLATFPSYNGWRANGRAIFELARGPYQMGFYEIKSSLLALGFNECWIQALNHRDVFTHFLLVHADVRPVEEDWFEQLYEEMTKNQADLISAIIPIKDNRGLTSTARDTDRWKPIRYTVKEILQKPVTWTEPDLLFNTGMMLVDLSKPWVEKVRFTVNDQIIKNGKGWETRVESEDWNFARQCRSFGVKAYVTRRVKILHRGDGDFNNFNAWGEDHDFGNDPEREKLWQPEQQQIAT